MNAKRNDLERNYVVVIFKCSKSISSRRNFDKRTFSLSRTEFSQSFLFNYLSIIMMTKSNRDDKMQRNLSYLSFHRLVSFEAVDLFRTSSSHFLLEVFGRKSSKMQGIFSVAVVFCSLLIISAVNAELLR